MKTHNWLTKVEVKMAKEEDTKQSITRATSSLNSNNNKEFDPHPIKDEYKGLTNVKKIIAISSQGGVGKSTIAVKLTTRK